MVGTQYSAEIEVPVVAVCALSADAPDGEANGISAA